MAREWKQSLTTVSAARLGQGGWPEQSARDRRSAAYVWGAVAAPRSTGRLHGVGGAPIYASLTTGGKAVSGSSPNWTATGLVVCPARGCFPLSGGIDEVPGLRPVCYRVVVRVAWAGSGVAGS